MEEIVHLILKSYGVVGLIMVSPVVAVVYLWRDNIRLNNEARAMQFEHAKLIDVVGQRVVSAQEKRVEDAQRITTQLVGMISEHTGAQKETNTALDRVGDMVSMLLGQQSQRSDSRRAGGG